MQKTCARTPQYILPTAAMKIGKRHFYSDHGNSW